MLLVDIGFLHWDISSLVVGRTRVAQAVVQSLYCSHGVGFHDDLSVIWYFLQLFDKTFINVSRCFLLSDYGVRMAEMWFFFECYIAGYWPWRSGSPHDRSDKTTYQCLHYAVYKSLIALLLLSTMSDGLLCCFIHRFKSCYVLASFILLLLIMTDLLVL